MIDAQNSHSWYFIDSLKAKVWRENDSKILAYLNTDMKINVMTRKIMKDAVLALRYSPKIELISHTDHNDFFLGFYEDIEVFIGGLKMRHSIFIVEHKDYDLVLDQPFLNFVKFSQKSKPDDIFSTITHFRTYQSAVF